MNRLALPFLFAAVLLTIVGCGSSGSQRALTARKACTLDIAGTHASAYEVIDGVLAAELPDGSVVVGSSRRRHSELVVTLRRLTPDCRVVRSFGKNGTASVGVEAKPFGAIDDMLASPGGRLLLGGGDGRRELVGRLLADGRPDGSFGQDGWEKLEPRGEKVPPGMPPPSFTATSIAIGPSGSIFLGADDGDAHCCVHDFVSELTSEGTPAAAFGDGGSVLLPTFTGSYATQVSVNGDGSLYSLGEYEGSGCGGPSIARVEPDGSLDRQFDASVARTIKTAVSKEERFTPTLVARPPSGAFALVGGLDRTCVSPTARMPGGGVVMAIQPSGRIGRDGKTSFSVPGYAFDSPAALRLASGQILAAAVVYRSKKVRLLVRAFRADGSVDRGFGRLGVRKIDLPRVPRTAYASIALVSAAGGGAWLVVGLPNEIELVPLG